MKLPCTVKLPWQSLCTRVQGDMKLPCAIQGSFIMQGSFMSPCTAISCHLALLVHSDCQGNLPSSVLQTPWQFSTFQFSGTSSLSLKSKFSGASSLSLTGKLFDNVSSGQNPMNTSTIKLPQHFLKSTISLSLFVIKHVITTLHFLCFC